MNELRSFAKSYSHYFAILIVLLLIAISLPIGRDWPTFNISTLAQIRTPYDTNGFVGMPFVFFALPHSLLPVGIGNAVNLTLNVLVIAAVAYRYAGKQWHIAFAITLTAPTSIDLLMTNNIDWLPLLSFLVADWLAYPLLAMKPQMLGGAAIIRFKRNPNPLALIPLFVMLVVSVLIWGAWWTHLGSGLMDVPWNFAPFPYLIPVGCWLLWQAWQRDDEIIAACATCFFVPYFAPYSITGVHVLLTSRYRRVGMWLWIASWWFVIIAARRIGV